MIETNETNLVERETMAEQEMFESQVKSGYVESKKCVDCGKPVLTGKGEHALDMFAEAEELIDAGEFSDNDHYDGFCQCGGDDDMWDQCMPDCIDPRIERNG